MKDKIKIIIVLIVLAIVIIAGLMYGGFFAEKKTSYKNEEVASEALKKEIEEGGASESVAEELNQSQESEIEGEKVPEVMEKKPIEPVEEKSPSVTEDKKVSLNIVNRLVSFGHQKATGRSIDTVIIHSSYDALGEKPFSVNGIIDIYGQYGVAAHYLISREGTIYRLVEDKNIAYHAGVSQVPDGRTNVNDFSIGIELVNTKTDKYTDDQYNALNKLLNQLKSDYKIKYVLGHNQIAPDRKDDPWNFNPALISDVEARKTLEE